MTQTTNLRLFDVEVPERCQPLLTRVAEGMAAPRDVIKAKCQECVGYEDIQRRVGECTVYRCPLWGYRPYQKEVRRAEARQ